MLTSLNTHTNDQGCFDMFKHTHTHTHLTDVVFTSLNTHTHRNKAVLTSSNPHTLLYVMSMLCYVDLDYTNYATIYILLYNSLKIPIKQKNLKTYLNNNKGYFDMFKNTHTHDRGCLNFFEHTHTNKDVLTSLNANTQTPPRLS